jgi:hypothetical protein
MAKTTSATKRAKALASNRSDRRLVADSFRLLRRVRESGVYVDSGYSLAIPFSTRLNSKTPQTNIAPTNEEE